MQIAANCTFAHPNPTRLFTHAQSLLFCLVAYTGGGPSETKNTRLIPSSTQPSSSELGTSVKMEYDPMNLDGNGEVAPKQMEVKITEVSRRCPTHGSASRPSCSILILCGIGRRTTTTSTSTLPTSNSLLRMPCAVSSSPRYRSWLLTWSR